MCDTEKLCNNIVYLAKKRKVKNEIKKIKDKMLKDQCLSFDELTKQYLIEKNLISDPAANKANYDVLADNAQEAFDEICKILNCLTDIKELLNKLKETALKSTGSAFADNEEVSCLTNIKNPLEELLEIPQNLTLPLSIEDETAVKTSFDVVFNEVIAAIDVVLSKDPIDIDLNNTLDSVRINIDSENTAFEMLDLKVGASQGDLNTITNNIQAELTIVCNVLEEITSKIREQLDTYYQTLKKQIDQISGKTVFENYDLATGSIVHIVTGPNFDSYVLYTIPNVTTIELDISTTSVDTLDNANNAITSIDNACDVIDEYTTESSSLKDLLKLWAKTAEDIAEKFKQAIEDWKQEKLEEASERICCLSDQLELIDLFMGKACC